MADEMGLGKTVEMLALILSHKWPGVESSPCAEDSAEAVASVQIMCMCGDNTESSPGDFGMVQCEKCWNWQHMYCCGFSEEHGDVFVCTKCLLQEVRARLISLFLCPSFLLSSIPFSLSSPPPLPPSLLSSPLPPSALPLQGHPHHMPPGHSPPVATRNQEAHKSQHPKGTGVPRGRQALRVPTRDGLV